MEDSHTSEVDQHLQQVKLLEDSLNMERLAHQETQGDLTSLQQVITGAPHGN